MDDALLYEDFALMEEEEEEEETDVSDEEKAAESEALSAVKDDELRSKVATDLGIDPDEESELLDKIVKRELAQRERLSGAIKQKINWRDKALKSSKKPDNSGSGKTQNENLNIDEIVEQKLNEKLEAKELDSLELPDDLKTEVKDLAKLKGISVREAAKHPYILTRKEEIDREAKIAAATPKRNNRGNYTPNVDPSKPLNPADFDFNTKEGIQAWKEAKAARAKYMAQK